jgi:hypothetical protein
VYNHCAIVQRSSWSAQDDALAVEVGTSTGAGSAGGDHAAMTIVRSEHRAQFTIVPNAILRDALDL